MGINKSTDAFKKLQRFTRTVPGAIETLRFMEREATIKKLIAAGAEGIPPVTAISSELIKLVGEDRAQNPELAKFIGRVTRLIMEEHGYEIARRNVRVRSDPLFTSAAAYQLTPRRAETSTSGAAGHIAFNQDLLIRFLDTLRRHELEFVSDYTKRLLEK